jgi:hypothetical protein
MHDYFVRPDHLSPTQTAGFMRCPRLWMYRRMGLESPGRKSALVFGEAFHHAAGFAIEGRVPEAVAAFDAVWDESLADPKRNRARAMMIIRDFSMSHVAGKSLYSLIPPPRGVEVPDRVSQWEVPFAFDAGLPIPIVGRIDGVGKHRDTGETWAVEFKTTSQLGATFLSMFNLDPQILTYAYALQTYGVPESPKVAGTIVDGVLVAATKVDSMCQPIHVRPHSMHDMLDWYMRAWHEMSRCMETDDFPKNISACAPYSGFGMPGYVCQYQSLCLAGPNWDGMLGMYERNEPRKFEIVEIEDKTVQPKETK